MSRMRLISVLALAISAMVVAAPSAHAAGDDGFGAAACVLLPGVAGTTTDGGNGVNSVGEDVLNGGGWDPLNLLDTDPGAFEFNGSAVCGGADIASEQGTLVGGPEPVATTVQITAFGTYDNLICGTGTANGSATVSGGGITIVSDFGITFAGGKGTLSYVVTGGSVNDNTVDGGNGYGAISITPSTGDCGATAVSEFTVAGGFAGSLSGEGSTTSGTPDSDA